MGRLLRPLLLTLGLASLALASGACGNRKAVEAIQKFTDRMCACEDADCAHQVEQDRQTWIEKNPRPRGTESDRDKVKKALEKFQECRDRIPEGGGKEGGGKEGGGGKKGGSGGK